MLKAWRRLLGEVGEPAPAVDWPAVEGRFGTTLPVDYKLLADNYPALNIDNFLAVVHPVGGEDTDSLLEFVERVLGWFRARREDFPEEVPFPLWPEPGGLLPWGSTDNNDHVFWLTIGEPDRWPVVTTGEGPWSWREGEAGKARSAL
jgi:hypothetical protein